MEVILRNKIFAECDHSRLFQNWGCHFCWLHKVTQVYHLCQHCQDMASYYHYFPSQNYEFYNYIILWIYLLCLQVFLVSQLKRWIWYYIISNIWYFSISQNDEYDTEISQSADTMVLIAIGSLNINMRDKVRNKNEKKE